MLKNSSQFDGVFDPIFILKLLNYRRDFERQIDICGNSIGHNFKSSVWGDESDRPITVEPPKPNALMKLDIVNLDSFLLHLTIVFIVVSD